MKIIWTEQEATLLHTVAPQIDPTGDLDDDTVIFLTEEIGHHLALQGIDAQDNPNQIGLLCENIIDKLTGN